ncbi:MAG: hypothetical protein K1X88_05935 [Nannocystaceae bacterium]|nr:hypothetical protein [Nannocystaceae bacterium]
MRTQLSRLQRRRPAGLVVGIGLIVAACESASGPAPATFTEIYDRYFPTTTPARCNFCHAMPASQVSNGNLAMGSDPDSAYAALVGVASASDGCSGQPLVTPYDPDRSLFLDKFSDNPSCGSRMPLGGAALDAEAVDAIRGWIEAGAAND